MNRIAVLLIYSLFMAPGVQLHASSKTSLSEAEALTHLLNRHPGVQGCIRAPSARSECRVWTSIDGLAIRAYEKSPSSVENAILERLKAVKSAAEVSYFALLLASTAGPFPGLQSELERLAALDSAAVAKHPKTGRPGLAALERLRGGCSPEIRERSPEICDAKSERWRRMRELKATNTRATPQAP